MSNTSCMRSDTPLHVAARRGDAALVAALLPAVKKHYARNGAKLTAAEVALLEAPAAPAEGPAAAAGGGAAIAEAIVAAGGEPGEAGMGLMRAAVERKADGLAAKAAMAYVARFEPEHAAADCVVDEASGNSHLHLVAEAGAAAEACRALVAGGADLLRRNNKNRTPKTQVWRQWRAGRGDSGAAAVLLKLPEAAKAYLEVAEEEFKAAKEAKKSALWDDKMKGTQTESAFGFSVVLTHVEEEAAAAWGRETQLVEASAPHADEYESPNDLGFWRVDIEDQAAFICNELDLSDEQALYLLNALGLLPEGAALPDFRGQPEGQQQYEQELEQQQEQDASQRPSGSMDEVEEPVLRDALESWQDMSDEDEDHRPSTSQQQMRQIMNNPEFGYQPGDNGGQGEEYDYYDESNGNGRQDYSASSSQSAMVLASAGGSFQVSIKPNISEAKPSGPLAATTSR
eukprot:XP_001700303.1 predicted protein [Chlamydomonas reinhardtii]